MKVQNFVKRQDMITTNDIYYSKNQDDHTYELGSNSENYSNHDLNYIKADEIESSTSNSIYSDYESDSGIF